jgi:hypothetical protein
MKSVAASGLACCLFLAGLGFAAPASAQKKDYLSSDEADSIRDSDPGERIKLFISFAADRIMKLQYELAHPGNNTHPEERANKLINDFADCLDDASDQIDLSVEKQQDIRLAIKEMQARAPEFLTYLKGLLAQGAKVSAYKESLDNAIDATNDAIKSANEAAKTNAPPPVRRKPA